MRTLYYIFSAAIIACIICPANAQVTDTVPQHDTFNIHSELMGEERRVNVWMPSLYKLTGEPLPVIYMADGGVKEDFPHVANTLAKLIDTRKIRPIILVGIENTQRRRDLTGSTEVAEDRKIAPLVGGSAAFRAFIQEELFPEVSKRYRITAARSIIGESLSGLFVMETFFLAPDMFDNYIAFDPSLWWNDHALVRTAAQRLTSMPVHEKSIWFASSNTEDIAPFTKQLSDILRKNGPEMLRWKFCDEPTEEHSTIFRATKEKALIWTFGQSQ